MKTNNRFRFGKLPEKPHFNGHTLIYPEGDDVLLIQIPGEPDIDELFQLDKRNSKKHGIFVRRLVFSEMADLPPEFSQEVLGSPATHVMVCPLVFTAGNKIIGRAKLYGWGEEFHQ